MSTTDDQIRELREAQSRAQARVTRAQVELDNATERKSVATQTLKSFGVSNKDEALAMKAKLQEELDETIAQAREELEAAGA